MTKRKNIPFSPPDISENEVQGVVEALKSGWITTGPKTKEFEKKIAEFCGTSKAGMSEFRYCVRRVHFAVSWDWRGR